jgi:hypothetical protein
MHNVGVAPGYIEGQAMLDLGRRMNEAVHGLNAESRVFWSGRGDRIEGLRKEVNSANRYKADYFVSLHSDSAGDRHGVIVAYYYSEAGKRLAYALVRPVAEKLGLRFELRSNNTFYVLKHTSMPAVLIETLNHSSHIDCAKLAKVEFRQRMADALAAAYAKYIGLSPVQDSLKERRVHMQHGKTHYITVVPRDTALHVTNTDDDTDAHIVRRHFDADGGMFIDTVEVIPPRKTWSLKLENQYGLIVLRAMGSFVSRVE